MNETTTPRAIRTNVCSIEVLSDDILRFEIDDAAEFDLEDFTDVLTAAKHLRDGRKMKNLIILGEFTIPDHEVRKACACEKVSMFKIADAFVVKSLTQKLASKVYLNLNKPAVPTKFFEDEKDAIEWLKNIHR